MRKQVFIYKLSSNGISIQLAEEITNILKAIGKNNFLKDRDYYYKEQIAPKLLTLKFTKKAVLDLINVVERIIIEDKINTNDYERHLVRDNCKDFNYELEFCYCYKYLIAAGMAKNLTHDLLMVLYDFKKQHGNKWTEISDVIEIIVDPLVKEGYSIDKIMFAYSLVKELLKHFDYLTRRKMIFLKGCKV